MKNLINISVVLVLGFVMAFSFFDNKTKEEKFWEWFVKNEKSYYHLDERRDKEFDKLSNQLSKIDDNLTFEFSPTHDNGIKEFTISADGFSESFPDVIKLVEKAPKIKNWQIHAFRQRIPGNDIEINYGDTLTIGYEDIYFRYGHDEEKIGIELNIKNYVDDPKVNHAIYILLDGLIGEYDMETQISWIERIKLDESKTDTLFKLVELRDIIDSNKKENK